MEITSTDMTIEHYSRSEVKDVILKWCEPGRALNADDRWYARGNNDGEVRLTSPSDYDNLIKNHRTLFATIDVLDHSVFEISRAWDGKYGRPVAPIGTLADCQAFTLSVDIDSIKDKVTGAKIINSPEIKAAVECAGQYFVDYLRDRGIAKSLHVLQSGGGLYIHIHHMLYRNHPEWTPEETDEMFARITIAYNLLIADIGKQFFLAYPEHKGKVKYDLLNNQKRKFKCIFSVHRKLPYVVIPVAKDHIYIDFEKASLPLLDEVIEDGKKWYQEYDTSEKEALTTLLVPFDQVVTKKTKDRGRLSKIAVPVGSVKVRQFEKAIPLEQFAPCMLSIINECEPDKGPHRALAILASYLYQAGWSEEAAFKLWSSVADRTGVEGRIFDVWFGRMHCPSCEKIRANGDGYPHVGLGGLYCAEGCKCQPLH